MPSDDESGQEEGTIALPKSLIGISERKGYCQRIYCVKGKPSKRGGHHSNCQIKGQTYELYK
jgi:hypothetical protein